MVIVVISLPLTTIGEEYGLSDLGRGCFQRMLVPVLMYQLRGKDFSLHSPWPVGPRNCVQSSPRATGCQWHRSSASKINLIRMIVINHQSQMTLGVNQGMTRAE